MTSDKLVVAQRHDGLRRHGRHDGRPPPFVGEKVLVCPPASLDSFQSHHCCRVHRLLPQPIKRPAIKARGYDAREARRIESQRLNVAAKSGPGTSVLASAGACPAYACADVRTSMFACEAHGNQG